MISPNIINKKEKQSGSVSDIVYKSRVNGKLTVNHSPNNIYNNILFEEKKTIGFKIPLYYHIIYREKIAPFTYKRRLLIESLKELIVKIAEVNPVIINNNNDRNIVVNLNPQIIIENNVRAESRAEVKIDLSDVLAELEELRKLVYNWYKLNRIPKAAYDTSIQRIKKIEKIIKQVN